MTDAPIQFEFPDKDSPDDRPEVQRLLARIKSALPELEATLKETDDEEENLTYRFYHHSFKVYQLQAVTQRIVVALTAIMPERPLTGKVWELPHNSRWLEVTRPIVEAAQHARYFLRMAVKYGTALKHPPRWLPTGWAAILYLYDLRYESPIFDGPHRRKSPS